MPQVLWLTPVPPDHRGGGGHLRQAHLLDALAAHADVDLVVSGRVTDGAVASSVRSLREIDVHEDDWSGHSRAARRGRDLWLATGSRAPREVAAFAPVRRAMQPIAEGYDGDIVLVEFAGLAPLIASRVPGRPTWILTLHNLGSTMSDQLAAVTGGGRQRWLYQRDGAKARRWEQSVVRQFDRVIAVSELDARTIGQSDVLVVPNGVDVEQLHPSPLPTGPKLVFTGALYTAPNVDGIRWFCSEILPLIRVQEPETTLAIAGSRPTDDVRALTDDPGVAVSADVDTTAPFLKGARVALVPLRIGSGSRLKALEAMAAGRPVVGTSVGFEGLDLRPGYHALAADDPASFADAVVRLVRDDALAQRQAERARAMVIERYDWRRVGEGFVKALLASAPG